MKKIITLVLSLLLVLVCSVAWSATYNTIFVNNPYNAVMTQYPVELKLDASFDWTGIDANFTSLRFYLQDGTPIDYWIEFLDVTNTKAVIWLRIPSLPVAGLTLKMMYSPTATTAYQAQSYTAHITKPATGLTLLTYPLDKNGDNCQMLHPTLIKAEGWTQKATADAGSQNVFWIMSNTPFLPTALLPDANWTKDLTENPALWVCSNTDPTTDNWSWPNGADTGNGWPEYNDVNSVWSGGTGTDFDKALQRFNTTLHPANTHSNLVVAPYTDDQPWSDPTIVWINSSQTLRVYFHTNSTNYPMYYCDITSPIDHAWADASNVSHLTFTYGKCKIGANDFDKTQLSNKIPVSICFY